MSEFWGYDIDSRCKTHLLGRNFSKIKFLLPSEISTVEISGHEISQNGAEISAISRHRNLKKIKICSKTAKMGPEWPQIGDRVEKTILNTFRAILGAFRPFIGQNSNIRILAGKRPGSDSMAINRFVLG